jgi:hypothetical protein
MLRKTHGLAIAVLTAGCTDRVSLLDVPIVGGSNEQREAAEAELRAFDDAVGPGRLTITSVVFKDLGDFQGRYSLAWGRVALDDDLDPVLVRTNVRHELCHGLDYAENLLNRPVASFDDFGADLFDPEDGRLDYRRGARGRRSEALAQVCELGPFGAMALSEPCPGESELEADLASWVASNVWRDFDASVGWPAPEALASSDYAPQGAWAGFTLFPTVAPSRVGLNVGYDEVVASLDVDLYTGDPALGAPAEPALNAMEPPLTGLPLGADFTLALGWPSGPGVAVIELPITGLRTGVARLIASDGDGWGLVGDGCLDDDTRRWGIFTADDRVWYSWGDGLTVSWAPLGE